MLAAFGLSLVLMVISATPSVAYDWAEWPAPSCAFERALCGYVDADGQVVIPGQYDWAGRFYDHRARIQVGDHYGLIDEAGNEIAPPVYDGVSDYWHGMAQVQKGGRTALVDLDGKVLFEGEAQTIVPLDDTHMLEGTALTYFSPQNLGFRGFSLGDGVWTIVTVPTGARQTLGNGRVEFLTDEPGSRFWFAEDDTWRLFTTDGRQLGGSFEYGGRLAEGLIVAQRNGKHGFIDENANVMIDFQFDNVFDFSADSLAVFQNGSHGHWLSGYIDRTGKIVIPAQYEMAWPFDGNLADVILKGVPIQVDRTGQPQQECQSSTVVRKVGDTYRLEKQDGQPLNAETYDYAEAACGQPTFVEDEKRVSFVNDDGSSLGNTSFPQAFPFYDGVAVVWTDDGKLGIIGTDGAYIVKPLPVRARLVWTEGEPVIYSGPDYAVLTAVLARELAEDPTLLMIAPDQEEPKASCGRDGVDIADINGHITYTDATGAVFIEGDFDYASCFIGTRAWVAVRARREWCPVTKQGEILTKPASVTSP